MDFRLTDLQELLRNSAQEFFERELPSERLREIERAGEPDASLWAQVSELGWLGLPIDEAYGGQGGTLLDTSVLIEEICRAAFPCPFVSTVRSAMVIQQFGPADLKQRLLPEIVAGTVIATAVVEGSGRTGRPPTVTFDGRRVSGEKRFVEYGASAAYHLVTAVRDGVAGLALVPTGQLGLAMSPMHTIGTIPQDIVDYHDAEVEAWIEGDEASAYLQYLGSALGALECYSYAQKALDMTVDYVQMRVQFGQPVGAFQAVQNRVADMATIVEASRFLTHELLWNFDQGAIDPIQVAVVKAVTSQMTPQVVMDCHLLHGGIGYMQEYNLQFYSRRGKEASLKWGSTREMTNIIAGSILT